MKSSTPEQLPNSRSAIAAALVSFSISDRTRQAARPRSPRAARRASRRFGPKIRCPLRSISAGTPIPMARSGSAPSRWRSLAIAARASASRRAGSREPGRDSRSMIRPPRSAATTSMRSGSSRTPNDDPGGARDRERHRRPAETAHGGAGVRARDEPGLDELRGDGGDGRLVEAGQHRQLALRASGMAAQRLHQKHGVDAAHPGGIDAPPGGARLRMSESRQAIAAALLTVMGGQR